MFTQTSIDLKCYGNFQLIGLKLFFYCVFLKTNINFTNLEISIKNRISVNVSDVSLNLCPIQGCTARLQVGGYSLIHGPLAQVNELNAKLGFDSDGSVECEKTSSMSSLCFLLKSWSWSSGDNFWLLFWILEVLKGIFDLFDFEHLWKS